jgi:hypothetical protein
MCPGPLVSARSSIARSRPALTWPPAHKTKSKCCSGKARSSSSPLAPVRLRSPPAPGAGIGPPPARAAPQLRARPRPHPPQGTLLRCYHPYRAAVTGEWRPSRGFPTSPRGLDGDAGLVGGFRRETGEVESERAGIAAWSVGGSDERPVVEASRPSRGMGGIPPNWRTTTREGGGGCGRWCSPRSLAPPFWLAQAVCA